MESDTTSLQGTAPVAAEPPDEPVRLGLALSGGGFRATLFHLGVLTRLAEMDLLRHLHVISAVSGGSVIAAHYMLLLKRALESSGSGSLTRDAYIELVKRLRKELAGALRHQPRNQLLSNPGFNLRMLAPGWTSDRTNMSQRMADLYQRLLFREGTRQLGNQDPEALDQGVRLSDMLVKLPGLEAAGGALNFNERNPTDCVPQLVLNAATLNTASRFTFTFKEVGDELLGYVRIDERELLAACRKALDTWTPDMGAEGIPAELLRDRPRIAEHLALWRDANPLREGKASWLERMRKPPVGDRPVPLAEAPRARPPVSLAVRDLTEHLEDTRRFLEAPLAVLHAAKVAAWYLVTDAVWRPHAGEPATGPIRRGGRTREQHRRRFWAAIRDIDQAMAARVHPKSIAVGPETADEKHWYELAFDFYLFRTAQNLDLASPREIRLPTAVQASANFPPVFGAMRLNGLYDPARLEALRLSDGGLNDNNGIEALFDARCTHIIASEAGPRPVILPSAGRTRVGMMAQIVENQLWIVRRLLMRTLREQERVRAALVEGKPCVFGPHGNEGLRDLWDRYPVEAVAFFDMETSLSAGVAEQPPQRLPTHPLAREIANLRTDLDGFSELEQEALVYQGYQYCDCFVRRYVYDKLAARLSPPPKLPPKPPPPVAPTPCPTGGAEMEHAKRVLRAGRQRFFRAWKIGGPEGWLCLAATLIGGAILFGLLGLGWWAIERILVRLQYDAFLVRAIAVALSAGLLGYAWFAALLILSGGWLRLDGTLAMRAARKRPPRAATP